jgi:hypothetical protein
LSLAASQVILEVLPLVGFGFAEIFCGPNSRSVVSHLIFLTPSSEEVLPAKSVAL